MWRRKSELTTRLLGKALESAYDVRLPREALARVIVR